MDLKASLDTQKMNKLSITKIKQDLNAISNESVKKNVFRLAKNRLDLLENNFDHHMGQIKKELEKTDLYVYNYVPCNTLNLLKTTLDDCFGGDKMFAYAL